MDKSGNTILIIDDEAKIRRFVRSGFELHGYSVEEAENGAQGLKATLRNPSLIILDLALPDINGAEVLQRIREWSNVPVIMLSIVSDEQEKVRLLGLGADDYVVKPFGIAELLARTEAGLRRSFTNGAESHVITTGPLSIDLVQRAVFVDQKPVSLTRKEYSLLQILAKHIGLVMTHEQLIKEIWISNRSDNIQYLRILVRKLRQKIELDPNNPRLLLTESGIGYRLQRISD